MSATANLSKPTALLSQDQGTSPIRVLYIVGAGRSGSTLLDTVLANHPDVVGVGELTNLHSMGWTDGEPCSCGKSGGDCEFWVRVRAEWQRREPTADVAGYIRLQERFERARFFGLRHWGRYLREGRRASADYQTYLRQTAALFRAIATISGRTIIVDSSKSPLRAALLQRLPGFDVRLLHLIRDARAVAWSRKKALKADRGAGINREFRGKPTWISVGYWVWVNLLSLFVRRRSPTASLPLRYEDFVSNPAPAMSLISTWSGLDFSETTHKLLTGGAFQPQHTIAGNRLRMSGQVKLKPDWEWLEKLPSRDRAVCWFMAGWLLKRFGYSRIVPCDEPVQTLPAAASPQIPVAA